MCHFWTPKNIPALVQIGLAPTRRQAIIWTNGDYFTDASLGPKELLNAVDRLILTLGRYIEYVIDTIWSAQQVVESDDQLKRSICIISVNWLHV